MRTLSSLLLCSLVAACVPGNETQVLDLAPVDASAAVLVSVSNDTGAITLEGEANRTDVEVQVTLRGGLLEDFERVVTSSTLSGDTIEVLIDVPSDLPNVVGDVLVLAPSNVAAAVVATSGDSVIRGFSGGVSATSDGGAITCEAVTGGIFAQTNAGKVTLNTSLAQGELVKVTTAVIGDIELLLPGSTAADLIAVTGGGDIGIGADFNFIGDNAGGVAEGTLNGGGVGQLDLFTQSGDITLLAQ